jgi:hypothetical protein
MGELAVAREARPSPWLAIDYAPGPPDRFVAPESHWPELAAAGLTLDQRLAMNRLALRFSCEMVSHFERYVVEYLDTRRARLRGALPDRAAQRFADDEREHIAGFHRLLAALAPDAYREPGLRFFRWTWLDRLVVRLSPAVSFFVATDLLEEMFLHLHTVMEREPEQTLPAARAVMALHAREEKSHLGMDERVIRARAERMWRWTFALQALGSLAIIAVVDRKCARAWKRVVREEARALGLTRRQTRLLEKKRLSQSDLMGLRAFIARREERPFPGSRLLCRALATALPRP